jgi:hypothetical protein
MREESGLLERLNVDVLAVSKYLVAQPDCWVVPRKALNLIRV